MEAKPKLDSERKKAGMYLILLGIAIEPLVMIVYLIYVITHLQIIVIARYLIILL